MEALAIPDRVLSRPDILLARDAKQILIEPFEDRCVKGGSVDVRLGEWYFAEQPVHRFGIIDCEYVSLREHWIHRSLPRGEPYGGDKNEGPRIATTPILNPYDEKSVASMWGTARKAEALKFDLPRIKAGTPVIIIPPGGAFLGHTMEFIGSLHPEITFMVKARSSVGRCRIRVCACAGWGDQGYANRITFDLHNDSKYRSTVLVPGRRVGQIVFIPTTPLPEKDLYYKSGKYQESPLTGKTYEQLLEGWKPEDMLPRMHLDWDAQEE